MLREQLTERQFRARGLETENEHLREEAVRHRAALEKKDESLKDQTRQIEYLRNQIEKIKDKFGGPTKGASLEREQLISELEDKISKLKQENAALRQSELADEKVRRIESQLSVLDNQNGDLQDTKHQLQRRVKSLESELTMKGLDLQRLTMLLDKAKEETAQVDDSMMSVKMEKVSLQERMG